MPEDEDTFVAEKPSCRIIVSGNPIEGLLFYGPFDDTDAAVEFAEDNEIISDDDDWWVGKVYSV
jgi:hypothetical protein